MNAAMLTDAIKKACPIDGVSIADPTDRSTWRIDFSASATDAQKTAAQKLLNEFVEPVPPRAAPGEALIAALTDDQARSVKTRDLLRITARGSDPIPETSPMLARASKAAGLAVTDWLTAASA